MDVFDIIKKFICKKNSLKFYFLLMLISLLIGIFLISSLQFTIDPEVGQLDKEELTQKYYEYVNNQTPRINSDFGKIFTTNVISCSITILFPVIVLIVFGLVFFIIPDNPSNLHFYWLKIPIFLIMIITGYKTFSTLYYNIRYFPLELIFSFYLPHGIFEITTIVLGGVFALIISDELIEKIRKRPNFSLKTGFIVIIDSWKNIAKYLLVVTSLLLIAAFIETFITPYVVKETFKLYLQL